MSALVESGGGEGRSRLGRVGILLFLRLGRTARLYPYMDYRYHINTVVSRDVNYRDMYSVYTKYKIRNGGGN